MADGPRRCGVLVKGLRIRSTLVCNFCWMLVLCDDVFFHAPNLTNIVVRFLLLGRIFRVQCRDPLQLTLPVDLEIVVVLSCWLPSFGSDDLQLVIFG